MLRELITSEDCKNCRVCCGFYESEKWEIPIVFNETRDYIKEKTDLNMDFVPYGKEYVFKMDYKDGGDYIALCPSLDPKKGCVLDDKMPFDCKIWPFRVMENNDSLVLTLSPLCKVTKKKSIEEINRFVNSGFADLCFEKAKKHREIIKPYIKDYPIFAVNKPKIT